MLWAATLAAALTLAAEPTREDVSQLRRGMGRADVRQCVGSPERVTRVALFHRLIEHWSYSRPFPFRIEFDGRRGEEAFVTAIRMPPPQAGVR